MGVLLRGFEDKHLQEASANGLEVFRADGLLAVLDLAVIDPRESRRADVQRERVSEEALVRSVEHKHGREGRGRRVNFRNGIFTSSERLDL